MYLRQQTKYSNDGLSPGPKDVSPTPPPLQHLKNTAIFDVRLLDWAMHSTAPNRSLWSTESPNE